MLLGIWGPFSVGKTTYLTQYMERQASNLAFKNVVFVFADLSMEYHMDKNGHWNGIPRKGDEDHWKGKQDIKEAYIQEMVADDKTFWVVESARYFSGMYGCLVDAVTQCDGGLRFIVPVTDGPTMVKFMKARCEKRNKVYREDYWDERRVAYEADARYTNAVRKWLEPAGVPCEVFTVDETRETFRRAGGFLSTWLKLKPEQWYGMTDAFKKLAAGYKPVKAIPEQSQPRDVEELMSIVHQRKGRY